MTTESYELPRLPAPAAEAWGNSQDPRFDAFTSDQMREYALLAVKAERERCARVCENLPVDDPAGMWFNDDMSLAAEECAAAIRRG